MQKRRAPTQSDFIDLLGLPPPNVQSGDMTFTGSCFEISPHERMAFEPMDATVEIVLVDIGIGHF